MRPWKIDKTMAIWGIAFGVFTIITGTFLLSAVEGGFLAEGFFLIVLSWIIFFVIVAKIISWIEGKSGRNDFP